VERQQVSKRVSVLGVYKEKTNKQSESHGAE
jgi:hypothetical protein